MRAITGERELERLLSALMKIIMQNAGADVGALVIESDGELVVQAAQTPGCAQPIVMQALRLEAAERVAASIVHYVARRREPVVVDEPAIRGPFAGDRYIRAHRPQSILFMDDPDHGRVRGPLTQAFYKRAAKMKPQVKVIVDEVLDGLAGRASFDVIADYGIPVPILVIAAVLGVPSAMQREFR